MVSGTRSAISNAPVDARRANTMSMYAPGGSTAFAAMLNPDGWNCAPKTAATSGRDTPSVALPRNFGEPVAGIAQACTASMPLPLDAS
jgi:hypothetical protein